jgi:membrane fusion protein (multidrug efflux system)
LGAGLIGFQRFKAGILKQVTASIQSQTPTIATGPATLQDWQPRLAAVGSTRAANGADISPEIAGVVEEIRFESGQNVAAGAVLLRLRGNDDEAKLAQLQASADANLITYNRDLKQLAVQGVAQATVDTDAANLKVARAQVAAQQALMAEKLVRAPFAGRLGVRQVDIGQYLAAGTKIVTLQSLDPMFVDFHLPQQALGQVAVGARVEVTADAYPGRVFTGTVSAIDSKIDDTSRMVSVRAVLRNPDVALLPGMFVSLTTAAGPPQSLVTIPLSAVAFNPYGNLVYVVEEARDDTGKTRKMVHQVFVTTGDQRGDQVAILKGLKAGDVVVTAGQIKLHNDMAVNIDNAVQPTNNPAPTPADQ